MNGGVGQFVTFSVFLGSSCRPWRHTTSPQHDLWSGDIFSSKSQSSSLNPGENLMEAVKVVLKRYDWKLGHHQGTPYTPAMEVPDELVRPIGIDRHW